MDLGKEDEWKWAVVVNFGLQRDLVTKYKEILL
jgi:hypothetical protein